MDCIDCKNGHCHSCHREIVGAEHHESDGVYCELCVKFRSRISALEAERDKAVELLREQVACHRNGGWSLKDRCEAFLASIGGEGK